MSGADCTITIVMSSINRRVDSLTLTCPVVNDVAPRKVHGKPEGLSREASLRLPIRTKGVKDRRTVGLPLWLEPPTAESKQ